MRQPADRATRLEGFQVLGRHVLAGGLDDAAQVLVAMVEVEVKERHHLQDKRPDRIPEQTMRQPEMHSDNFLCAQADIN